LLTRSINHSRRAPASSRPFAPRNPQVDFIFSSIRNFFRIVSLQTASNLRLFDECLPPINIRVNFAGEREPRLARSRASLNKSC
jgi:hypothetical protein